MCSADFLHSFASSFGGCEINIARIGDSHPGRARNRAAAHFLHNASEDFLLFVDTDIIFTRRDIDMLAESEEAIVAGIYPLKSVELKPCLQTLPGHRDTATGGVIEIARAGTGFMRIRRDVFETLKSESNRYTNHGREEWDFFRSGVSGSEWLSEDWFFCDDARKAGFRVMCDTRIQLGHQGVITFPIKEKIKRLKYCADDYSEHMESIWHGEYDVDNADNPKTVLDIGGNIGGFTVWATERWPGCKITAFEPHPDNCTLFRLNTEHCDVNLEPYAVTRDGGVIQLAVGNNPGEHSVKINAPATHSLTVTAIEACMIPSHEFVKLDCEGCEPEICMELDFTKTKAVAIEYHSEADLKSIRQTMAERGFTENLQKTTGDGRGLIHFIK